MESFFQMQVHIAFLLSSKGNTHLENTETMLRKKYQEETASSTGIPYPSGCAPTRSTTDRNPRDLTYLMAISLRKVDQDGILKIRWKFNSPS